MTSDPSATLRALPFPSTSAAASYDAVRTLLVADVDRALADHPDIRRLIGNNPLRMMFDNHRNHAQFVASVLLFGRQELLVSTLPWVYRAYVSQGFSPRYFRVELGAWMDAVRKRLEPAEADSLLPLYRWMLEHHDVWIERAAERTPTALLGSEEWETERRGFFDAVRDGDSRAARRIASDTESSEETLLDFFEEVVRPAMYEIGLHWENGHLSPAREHRATAISLQVVTGLQLGMAPAPAERGRAVVGAAPNEHHELGAQMLATLLEADGWRVSYLGADTPIEDFVEMVRDESPSLVAISVAMPYNLERCGAVIAGIRELQLEPSPRVIVGGHAFRDMPELAAQLGVDAAPSDLREALEVTRAWRT